MKCIYYVKEKPVTGRQATKDQSNLTTKSFIRYPKVVHYMISFNSLKKYLCFEIELIRLNVVVAFARLYNKKNITRTVAWRYEVHVLVVKTIFYSLLLLFII